MKILAVLPFYCDESIIKFFEKFVPGDLAGDVDVVGLSREEAGSDWTGERISDIAYSVPGFLNCVMDAEKRGYDAVINVCHADRGIQEARELVDIPVLGSLMVAMHISTILGHRLCIIKPTLLGRLETELNIRGYGFEGRVVVRGIKSSAEGAFYAYQEYKAKGKLTPFVSDIVTECIKAIEEDRVDVITFGCGVLVWMKEVIDKELAKKGYIATVVNPFPAALEMARTLVKLKLTHNKIVYPKNVHKVFK